MLENTGTTESSPLVGMSVSSSATSSRLSYVFGFEMASTVWDLSKAVMRSAKHGMKLQDTANLCTFGQNLINSDHFICTLTKKTKKVQRVLTDYQWRPIKYDADAERLLWRRKRSAISYETILLYSMLGLDFWNQVTYCFTNEIIYSCHLSRKQMYRTSKIKQ